MPPPAGSIESNGPWTSKQPIAPGAVRNRDVAHPQRVPVHGRGEGVDEAVVGRDRPAQSRLRRDARPAEVVGERRIRRECALDAIGKTLEDDRRIAVQEAFGRVGEPAVSRRIGVDVHAHRRQPQPVGTGFVAAKPRADDDHQVDRRVERFDVVGLVEGAERHRMVFGNDAAPPHARDDADAHAGKSSCRRACVTRAAAKPQERAPGGCQTPGERVQRVRRRLLPGDGERPRIVRRVGLRRLNVGGDLDADRTSWRSQRGVRGFAQDRRALAGLSHLERGLRDCRQHLRLGPGFVDESVAPAEVRGVDLTGEVQERGFGRQCLDERAGGVAGTGAGAGDGDADGVAHPGMGIGHVHRARLAARGDEPYPPPPADRVEDRQVVDADDAEGRGDAELLQHRRDHVARGGVRLRQGAILARMRSARPPGAAPAPDRASVCAPNGSTAVSAARRRPRGWHVPARAA